MSPFKTQPFQHQLTALEKSEGKSGYAFLMEMGTGKSKVAIDDAARLYRSGEIDGLFIVGNKGSYLNWLTTQIPNHMPDDVPTGQEYWDGNVRCFIPASIPSSKHLKIFAMNVEGLAFPRAYKEAEKFLRTYKCLFVVDESTTIKTVDSKRTKAAIKLGRLAKYRRILTGSPITKNPLDLYAQCEFLEKGLLGYTSYYAFRARYADMFEMRSGQRSFKVVRGYKNLEELTAKLDSFSYRVTKEDCLDLPPKIYTRHTVELTVAQDKLYKQLKEEAMATLASQEIVFAPLAITQMLRLHQVVCGHLPKEDGTAEAIPSNRLSALMDILEETQGKVVIWATYTADIEATQKALAKEYGEESVCTYYGATSPDDRIAAVTAFQDSPELRFFVGNPKAGGYGITLHAASTMIYYSNDFNLETRLQSEDRIHRIGQTKSCTYIDLVSPRTVDEKIIDALRGKKQIAGEVLGDRWRGWL